MDEAFICLLYLLNLIAKLSNHAPIPRFSLICESFVWTPGLFLWQIEKMVCKKRRERYIQNTGQNSLVSLNMARYTVLWILRVKFSSFLTFLRLSLRSFTATEILKWVFLSFAFCQLWKSFLGKIAEARTFLNEENIKLMGNIFKEEFEKQEKNREFGHYQIWNDLEENSRIHREHLSKTREEKVKKL